MRYIIFVCAAMLLGACATNNEPATIAAECKVFTDPGFAVQGKRLKDKQWIGTTQQKGIDVCDWKLPKD
jgi:hypothetical protein